MESDDNAIWEDAHWEDVDLDDADSNYADLNSVYDVSDEDTDDCNESSEEAPPQCNANPLEICYDTNIISRVELTCLTAVEQDHRVPVLDQNFFYKAFGLIACVAKKASEYLKTLF